MTYTTDNRLATYNGDLISYDADGNMAIGPLDGTTVNYSYDSRNRLTSAGSLSYQYDAEDHRISLQDTGSGSTTYIINPSTLSQVLVSTDPQGNETYYVYGLGLIGQENPDSSYQSYHYDLRGSTAALTDPLGQVTDTFEYGPYGEFSTRTGTTQTPFLYNGRDGVMTDSNGLYYMRARYYNPEIKRFINQDILLGEIFDSQSLNRYVYVNGEPISSIDPFGLSTWSDIKAIPGTISEGVTGGVRVVKEETMPYLKSDEAKTAYKQTAVAVVVANSSIALEAAGPAVVGRCAARGPGKLSKPIVKTVDDILDGAKPGRVTKGRAKQYEKSGGYDTALKDFNSMGLKDVRDIPGGKVGKLPDGRTVNVRAKSSDGRPTVEIQDGKISIKIRY